MKNIKLCATVGVVVFFLSSGFVQASWFSREKTIAVNPLNDALDVQRNVVFSHKDYIDGFKKLGAKLYEDRLKTKLDLKETDELPNDWQDKIHNDEDLAKAVKSQKETSNMTMLKFCAEKIVNQTGYSKVDDDALFKNLDLYKIENALKYFAEQKKLEGAAPVQKKLQLLQKKANKDFSVVKTLFSSHPGYNGDMAKLVTAKIDEIQKKAKDAQDTVWKDKIEKECIGKPVLLSVLKLIGYSGNYPENPQAVARQLLESKYKSIAEFINLQKTLETKNEELNKKTARLGALKNAVKTHLNVDLPEDNNKIADAIKGELESDSDDGKKDEEGQ